MMVIPYDLFWQSISMAFSHQGRWNDKKSWGYLGDIRILILGILDERHIPVDIESVLGYDVHQQLPHNPVVYHHCPYSNYVNQIWGDLDIQPWECKPYMEI